MKDSNINFHLMSAFKGAMEFFTSQAKKRTNTFRLMEGMVIVDYACGPGYYAIEYAKVVGNCGKVYAVDIQPIAVKSIQQKSAKLGIHNIEAILATGYVCPLKNEVADIVTALDVFFMIDDPTAFLNELSRISKPNGILILDDGHQSRIKTKEKLRQANIWEIAEETKDHIKCRKIFLN